MSEVTTRITDNTRTETREKRDVSDLLWHNSTGLLALMGGMTMGEDGQVTQVQGRIKKKTANVNLIEWFEKEDIAATIQINNGGGYNTTATTLTIDSSVVPRAHDVYINVTDSLREVFYIQSVTNATTIVVLRGISNNGTGNTIDDNDVWRRMSHADAEALGKRAVFHALATKKFNYTQIMKTTLSISRTDKTIQTFAGNNREELQNDVFREHARDMEQVLLFGRRAGFNDTTPPVDENGKKVNFAGGFLHFFTTNTYDANSGGYSIGSGFGLGGGHNGNLSADEFINEFIPQTDRFNHGVNTETRDKILIGPNPFVIAFSDFAKQGGLQVFTGDQMFGVRIQTIVTPFGNIKLMRSYIMEEIARDTAFLISPEQTTYRPLEGADVIFQENIHNPDFDGEEDQFLSEFTYEIMGEKVQGIISGVTSIDA